MNTFLAIILLAVGLVILWKCAELLVSGAVGLAERLGISPLIMGLTVVAMGTSAPEVAASIAAVLKEAGGNLAVGNVYGSNIANLALVGGVCALIRPITVRQSSLRFEMPIMLGAALLLYPFLHNLYFSRIEGVCLLGVFAVLILLTIHTARKQAEQMQTDVKYHIHKLWKSLLFIGVGLVGLAAGAEMSVEGAVFIGRKIGMSEAVIGLTIIAIGTSLPELVTCVVAALKGHDDISIGNLVGSNIFNTLLVTGTAGVVRPFNIDVRLIEIDYFAVIFISAAFFVMALTGRSIGRVKGLLLVLGYVCYMMYLLI